MESCNKYYFVTFVYKPLKGSTFILAVIIMFLEKNISIGELYRSFFTLLNR